MMSENEKTAKTNYIISISREFGSRGKEIGKALAEKLGLQCYDKSVTELTSAMSGFSKDFIEQAVDKSSIGFEYGFLLRTDNLPVYDKVFFAQCDAIKKLASKGPCIFIGRCSDYVLRDNPNLVKIFVYAPLEKRIEHVAERREISKDIAEKIILQSDKARAKYHDHYTSVKWGDEKCYDLKIDSSCGVEETVNKLVDFITNFKK